MFNNPAPAPAPSPPAAPIIFRIKFQCFTIILRSLPTPLTLCPIQFCSSHAGLFMEPPTCQTCSSLRVCETAAPLHGKFLFQILPAGCFLIFRSQHRVTYSKKPSLIIPAKVPFPPCSFCINAPCSIFFIALMAIWNYLAYLSTYSLTSSYNASLPK